MTEKYIALRVRMAKHMERRGDAGQGTLEYLGMILVAAILIVAVAAFVKGDQLKAIWDNAVQKVTGIG
jgi:hypothetical protein